FHRLDGAVASVGKAPVELLKRGIGTPGDRLLVDRLITPLEDQVEQGDRERVGERVRIWRVRNPDTGPTGTGPRRQLRPYQRHRVSPNLEIPCVGISRPTTVPTL